MTPLQGYGVSIGESIGDEVPKGPSPIIFFRNGQIRGGALSRTFFDLKYTLTKTIMYVDRH